MKNDIEITDQTVVDETPGRELGPQIVMLPEGEAICTDADSLSAIVAEDHAGTFVMIIAVASHEGLRLGSLSPMSPTQARSFAASLIEAANQVDKGISLS